MAKSRSIVVIVALMERLRIESSILRSSSWGETWTLKGQSVLESQCLIWGIESWRRGIVVDIPKENIQESTLGELGTRSVNGGRDVIVVLDKSYVPSICAVLGNVLLTTESIGRSPLKCFVLIARRE